MIRERNYRRHNGTAAIDPLATCVTRSRLCMLPVDGLGLADKLWLWRLDQQLLKDLDVPLPDKSNRKSVWKVAHNTAYDFSDSDWHANHGNNVGGYSGACRRHVDDETCRRAAVARIKVERGSRGTTRLCFLRLGA